LFGAAFLHLMHSLGGGAMAKRVARFANKVRRAFFYIEAWRQSAVSQRIR
jgi:hypothetical protein